LGLYGDIENFMTYHQNDPSLNEIGDLIIEWFNPQPSKGLEPFEG
jgi:hypothetical protein